MNNDAFVKNVASRLIEQIRNGTAPWQKHRWKRLSKRRLTAEDQLFIVMQAALYLSATRESAPEIRICYERAEFLCHSLNRPLLLYVILAGGWRHSAMTDKLTATMQIAKRIYSLAQEQNEPARMIGAYTVMAARLYHFGRFRDRTAILDAWC